MPNNLTNLDNQSLYLIHGEATDIEVARFEDGSGNVVDPSGWDVELYVVGEYGDEPEFTASLANGLLTVDANNFVRLSLTETESDDKLDPGTWQYFLRVDEGGSSQPYYSRRGKFIVQTPPVDRS